MKVTGETITDEQIRALRKLCGRRIHRWQEGLYSNCVRALGSSVQTVRDDARKACASAWNARHGDT